MKLKLVVALLLIEAMVLFTFSAVGAECNPSDLYCQNWTPADQAHKVRVETLKAVTGAYQDLLKGCDSTTKNVKQANGDSTTCVSNYDDSTGGLLGKIATKYNLPRDQVVLAAVALNWQWGTQATVAIGRPLVLQDWQNHYATGLNQFATFLSINPVMKIFDDGRYCVEQEYGGTCSGLW